VAVPLNTSHGSYRMVSESAGKLEASIAVEETQGT
jgi:hypothetical protein